ncbi:hypothetical protein [Fibrobacter sp.]|uniref:hypothetical protein n=1 Tax=Fibrobacter sp. TaxID=35828 RepID=UPI00261BC9BF|nr:hypothetical protein [Fibrobacter sp.]MDD7498672.1 hypothetical protein [Fibrobacter sp.]MDY5724966.1 hypothetical protein [Fibrobacter sp.]
MQIIEKLKNENDPEAQKALSEISKELLEKISREGLGYMSKTDLETFIDYSGAAEPPVRRSEGH